MLRKGSIKWVEHLYNNLRAGQKFSVKHNCSSGSSSAHAKDCFATGKHINFTTIGMWGYHLFSRNL